MISRARRKAAQRRASAPSPTSTPDADQSGFFQRVAKYHDPDLFCREVLGFKPWERQLEVMEAMPPLGPNRQVVVRSGHKVGKSRSAASVALQWAATVPGCTVVLTAPSNRQVDKVLWKETRQLHRRARKRLGGRLYKTPLHGLQYPDGRGIFGFSTDDPDAFSGISAPVVLYIVDEANGVAESIYEAIQGNRAGNSYLLLLGNPTKPVGTFYRAFSSSANRWHRIHIPSTDSPNIKEGREVIPGLASTAWLEEMEEHRGTPMYEVRVLGKFPSDSTTTVIGLGLIESGRDRYLALDFEPPPRGSSDPPRLVVPDRWAKAPQLTLGVDVARFGDDETVIQALRGYDDHGRHVHRGRDVVEVAGLVKERARDLRTHDGEKVRVNIDGIGIGAGVVDILKRSPELEVVEVNVGERADDEDHYVNLRAQLWFGLRDWLRDGGTLEDDATLHAELTATEYTFDARGRYKVTPKDEAKKVLKRSPDRADALCLAAYRGQRGSFAPMRVHLPGY